MAMEQQVGEDKGAGDWIRSKIKSGEVALDGEGVPNIIGNHHEIMDGNSSQM